MVGDFKPTGSLLGNVLLVVYAQVMESYGGRGGYTVEGTSEKRHLTSLSLDLMQVAEFLGKEAGCWCKSPRRASLPLTAQHPNFDMPKTVSLALTPIIRSVIISLTYVLPCRYELRRCHPLPSTPCWALWSLLRAVSLKTNPQQYGSCLVLIHSQLCRHG